MRNARQGSTLIEVAFVTVIVGVAITALMEFMTSATRANAAISATPVGVSIAKAGHEWARSELRDDLQIARLGGNYDYAPINTDSGEVLGAQSANLGSGMYSKWSQRFTMRPVLTTDLTATDPTGASPAMEITVTALQSGQAVASLSKVYYLD